MFRSLLVNRLPVSRVITKQIRPSLIIPTFSRRHFQTTTAILAKSNKKQKGGNKKNKKGLKEEELEEETEESNDSTPSIDFDDATSKFQGVIKRFSKQANEAKLGKTNPNIFDKLIIETGDGEVPFSSVAQTTIKGRNFIITVFDPSNAQSIINAVLGSKLNMNPQVDPSNKQSLKVPLPPLTTESKKENAKQLKVVFEKFKNGTGRPNGSLSSIRSDIKNKFQKQTKKKKLSDSDNKLSNDFEKLHKQYVDKLTEVFKAAEQAILR